MWATLGQDWGSCRENSKAETQFWEILKLGSEWQREAEMQNEAMGSPNFPNSYSQGSKNFCILQAPVTGPGPLSKLQSRRLYEKWSWVPQWNLSSACICFFTTIWSSFSPFSIALRKKKKTHKPISITDFKKQDTVKAIRNDSWCSHELKDAYSLEEKLWQT